MSAAVIGLGNMGLPMARTLIAKGVAVRGFDLSAERRALAAAEGVSVAPSLADAFATVTILSLPHASAVRDVIEGADGFLTRAPAGAIVIDTSTSEPPVSRALAALIAASGRAWLDGPVSGGPAGAAAGTMTMMVGGEADVLARARPILDKITAKLVHVGGPGAGHVAKLVNNLLCAANLVLVAEALKIGINSGVEAEGLLAAVNAASGRSAVSEVNFPRWILNGAFNSGFTMALMRKDVGLALKLAHAVDAVPEAGELIARLWAESTEPGPADFNRIAGAILAGP